MNSVVANHWRIAGRRLSLDRPLVMGILNVTPDSFSDGGCFADLQRAVDHAREMASFGADIIDIGGESTRPGAQSASLDQEAQRVFPVLDAIVSELDTPVSVDTSKPEIMREAIKLGAAIINDVNGFRAEGAIDAVAGSEVGLCIMHMQGEPRTMQHAPEYVDVVDEVRSFLEERLARCAEAGIESSRLCLDPGFGFGKTLDHNLRLLHQLGAFADIGQPLLVGISRKSMIGQITGRDVGARLPGSLSAAVLAASRGAHVLRVHDVAETVDALKVLAAVSAAGNGP